jgi:TonB family protein
MEANARYLRMQDTSDPKTSVSGASPQKADAPHVLHVRPDVPVEVSFLFEHPQSRVGISASVLSHIAMAVIAFLVMRYQPEAQSLDIIDDTPNDIVWLNEPGPGGGGGGGGNKAPEPPRKVELPGKEKITVPIEKIPEPKLAPPPEEIKPLEELNIPAKAMAAAEQPLPGAITREAPVTTSQGSGEGGGAGTGKGTGSGSGTGSGLGQGSGGGTGGGVYRPGSGVSVPRVLQEVKPQYTADAMRAKVQGSVWLECIVMPDGSVGNIRVTRSLDSVFGLDQEAIKAARQWKFVPGMKEGQPVPVLITIELTFTLR